MGEAGRGMGVGYSGGVAGALGRWGDEVWIGGVIPVWVWWPFQGLRMFCYGSPGAMPQAGMGCSFGASGRWCGVWLEAFPEGAEGDGPLEFAGVFADEEGEVFLVEEAEVWG